MGALYFKLCYFSFDSGSPKILCYCEKIGFGKTLEQPGNLLLNLIKEFFVYKNILKKILALLFWPFNRDIEKSKHHLKSILRTDRCLKYLSFLVSLQLKSFAQKETSFRDGRATYLPFHLSDTALTAHTPFLPFTPRGRERMPSLERKLWSWPKTRPHSSKRTLDLWLLGFAAGVKKVHIMLQIFN